MEESHSCVYWFRMNSVTVWGVKLNESHLLILSLVSAALFSIQPTSGQCPMSPNLLDPGKRLSWKLAWEWRCHSLFDVVTMQLVFVLSKLIYSLHKCRIWPSGEIALPNSVALFFALCKRCFREPTIIRDSLEQDFSFFFVIKRPQLKQ